MPNQIVTVLGRVTGDGAHVDCVLLSLCCPAWCYNRCGMAIPTDYAYGNISHS